MYRSTSTRFKRPIALFRFRLLAFVAVIGPGFITANVDNDPGGILTYSQAGARFGYTFRQFCFMSSDFNFSERVLEGDLFRRQGER